MKKKMIRGVALILVALSMLVLASACGSSWNNTTYTIKAYGRNENDWMRCSKDDINYNKKIKVSPLNKSTIPDIGISSKVIIGFIFGSYNYNIYLDCNVNNIKQNGKHNGYPKYKCSCPLEYGYSVRLTFYKTSDPDSGNKNEIDTNALRIDIYYYDEYKGTLYAYD